MENKILITKEKYEEVKKQYEQLISVDRPAVIKAIQEAREQGDLSENADYDAAKNRQAEIEAKIRECENILDNYELVKTTSKDVAKVGTTVEYVDLSDDKVYSYAIVGEVEANPEEKKISNVCPLAIAVLGHQVGDMVEIKGIEKPYRIKITKISRL